VLVVPRRTVTFDGVGNFDEVVVVVTTTTWCCEGSISLALFRVDKELPLTFMMRFLSFTSCRLFYSKFVPLST